MKLHKPDTPKRFGQDVCKLLIGAYMIDVNFTSVNTVTDEVIPCIYVFASFMMNWILA
jgi:hypothetical protein